MTELFHITEEEYEDEIRKKYFLTDVLYCAVNENRITINCKEMDKTNILFFVLWDNNNNLYKVRTNDNIFFVTNNIIFRIMELQTRKSFTSFMGNIVAVFENKNEYAKFKLGSDL